MAEIKIETNLSPELNEFVDGKFVENKRRVGPAKKSLVWKFFQFDEIDGRSFCRIRNSDGSICEKSLAGKNPTNLENHLKSSHRLHFASILKEKSSRAIANSKISKPNSQRRLGIRGFYANRRIHVVEPSNQSPISLAIANLQSASGSGNLESEEVEKLPNIEQHVLKISNVTSEVKQEVKNLSTDNIFPDDNSWIDMNHFMAVDDAGQMIGFARYAIPTVYAKEANQAKYKIICGLDANNHVTMTFKPV